MSKNDNDFQKALEEKLENMSNTKPYVNGGKGVWVQDNNIEINIDSMEANHIQSCIKKVKKDMNNVREINGDMEKEINKVLNKKLKELQKELKSRAD